VIPNLSFFIISVFLFAGLIYITGGIWFRSKRTATLKLFFAIGLMQSFWALFNGISVLLTQGLFEVFYPFYLTIVCFLPAVFLWYILYFTESKFVKKRWLTWVLVIYPLFDFFLLWTNPWHGRLITGYDGMYPLGGDLFPLHALLSYAPFLIGIIILIRYTAKNIRKIPALVYVVGGVLLMLASNILYTFGILDFGFDITPFTLIVMFSGFAIYSAQLRLFEAKENAELISAEEGNKQQLTKLNLLIRATKNALWDMEVINHDSANPEYAFSWSDDFRHMLCYTDMNDFPNLESSWSDCIHPDDKDRVYDCFSKHLEDITGNTPYDIEYRMFRKNGNCAYFRDTCAALRDENGYPVRVIGTIVDITEAKDMERKLIKETTDLRKREQELLHAKEMNELQFTKIRLINKAAKIGMWELETVQDDPMNLSNSINYSDGFREILGYTGEDDFPNVLSSFYNCLHPDDYQTVTDKITAHIADKTDGTPYNYEYQAKKKNGEYIYIRATGHSIRDEDGNAIRTLGTIMDISEEKNTLANTEKLRQEAEVASQSKSNFLANMSHEIRTPMNAIIGMTIIGKKVDEIEQKNHALNKIGDASSHLLGVINDVLDMAKIEANKLELAPIEYNFEHMLQKALTVVNFRVDEKKQQLTLSIDKKVPRYLIGDEQRLVQIITNLLSNAVKFTPEQGIIRLDASLISETDGNCELRIEVTDSGIGISAEQKERLFRAFEQAESGISRKYGGTGLGLTICKSIIELMGGKIWVESELGKGAKFIFTIKALRSDKSSGSMIINYDNESLDIEDSIDDKTAGFFAGRKLLVVEDIEINREIVIALLEDTGLIIDCAENGREALIMIEQAPDKYDIVFMDVQMPHMNGLEATRRIRALPERQRSRLPIIAMTANVFKSDIEDCLAAGMDDHLGKPLDAEKMIEKLKLYLA